MAVGHSLNPAKQTTIVEGLLAYEWLTSKSPRSLKSAVLRTSDPSLHLLTFHFLDVLLGQRRT